MAQAQLVITLEDDGRISVEGPIENKIACYGLLEGARDAIQKHHAMRAAAGGGPGIAVPNAELAAQLLKRSLNGTGS